MAIEQAWGGALPSGFMTRLRSEAAAGGPCLIALVAGPWPVLEIAGRLPRTSGFALVRAPLVPREIPAEEVEEPEAPEEVPEEGK